MEKPEIIQQIQDDEAEFLESIGCTPPEGPEPMDEAEARMDALCEAATNLKIRSAQAAAALQRRIDIIKHHYEQEQKSIVQHVQWIELQVQAMLPRDGQGMKDRFGKKSVNLPFGTVGYRAKAETVQVVDQDVALLFAVANNLKITVKRSVGVTPLKEHFQTTGEIPSGCEHIPASEKFFLKPRDGE